MHWTLDQLWGLDEEHYDALCELAPRWLGVEGAGEEVAGDTAADWTRVLENLERGPDGRADH